MRCMYVCTISAADARRVRWLIIEKPCVKEPSVDNFREAMHGDAARTAALLLMIACSTDAPAAIRCPG